MNKMPRPISIFGYIDPRDFMSTPMASCPPPTKTSKKQSKAPWSSQNKIRKTGKNK